MTPLRTVLAALTLGMAVGAPFVADAPAAAAAQVTGPPPSAPAPPVAPPTPTDSQSQAPRSGRAPNSTPATPAPQPPVAVPPAVSPPAGDRDDPFDDDDDRRGPSAVRIGQDYTLRAGDSTDDAVVILGNGTVAGTVNGDLVVILGTARVASTAIVNGDTIVIGGNATIESGATLRSDLVVVGGGVDAPVEFMPGGEQVIVGAGLMGGRLAALGPWVVRGLLWGRPIVPDLPWVWAILAFVLLVSAAVNALFDRQVYAAADVIREKPLTAFGAGLLVLLLIGPTFVVLAVSIIGLAVAPVVVCAVVAAWIVGKVAVARRLGGSIAGDGPANRLRALRALLIGFALLCVAYMIPVLGFVTWAITGVTGLGAAALTFIALYRRENPPVAAATPPPVPAPPVHGGVAVAPMTATAIPDAPAFAPAAAGVPPPAVPPLPAVAAIAFPHAFFRERLAAFALDVILVMIAVQMFDFRRGGRAFFLGLLVYHIGLWTWKQTTVGGIICQLRVVRVDGSRLTFADALVRGLSSIFSLIVLALGVLWILRDPERQAWHDKIAGTFVVKVPRNYPL